MDETELLDRLPELSFLTGQVRSETIDALSTGLPTYFWVVRASENHHPPDHRGLGGLWLHTKRAFTMWSVIESMYRPMSRLSGYEANCGRAAILLHDMFKYGHESVWDDYDDVDFVDHEYIDPDGSREIECILPSHTVYDHDVVAADWLRDNTALPEEVIGCVETHNGDFGDGPAPRSDLEVAHHMADALASRTFLRDIPVYDPCAELRATFPGLTELGVVAEEWEDEMRDRVV